jgi:hypothetical protein
MTPKRNRPGTASQAAPKSSTDILSIGPDTWHEAPTAEDRAVQAALKLLDQFGYGIAMRCVDCLHPITSVASLRRMRGPRCAARHKAEHGEPRATMPQAVAE